MNDAEKREKVILGLRCHKAGYYEECLSKCPYRDDGCETTLCNDAIALLKEQEPRVMTFEELNINTDEPVVCWVEFPGKPEINVTAPSKAMAHISLPFLGTDIRGFVVERNYGQKWRCWTSRPTPELMANTPWEGDKK